LRQFEGVFLFGKTVSRYRIVERLGQDGMGYGRWPALPVRLVEKSRVNALHNLRYTVEERPQTSQTLNDVC
jgi:hypothetical protein